MRIVSSAVSFSGQHQATRSVERHEKLEAWIDPPAERRSTPQEAAAALCAAPGVSPCRDEPADKDTLKIRVIEALLSALTGKEVRIEVVDPEDFRDPKAQRALDEARGKLARLQQAGNAQRQGGPNLGWGLRYEASEKVTDTESLSVSGQAQVRTADGRRIDLAVELRLARSFTSEASLSIRAGDALKDPIVVNYGGLAASLGERGLRFDLDADGELDQLSYLNAGSAFLALDRNANGRIDDGSELFGPTSGDGFAELAALDEDGNGWLDEGDAVFSKLRLWEPGPDGQDRLLALGERGIGAIYVGKIDAAFDYRDAENRLLGTNRAVGLFLKEDGGGGSLQQIDLAV